MNIVIVNGYPGAGKTTFENLALKQLNNNGYIISSIDFVKKVARKCGWDGEKTPENRKFLSDLKKLLTEWNDVPLKQICQEIRIREFEYDVWEIPTDEVVIFVDVREPIEIEKYKKFMTETYGWKVTTLYIDSKEENTYSNDSDKNVEQYNYDHYILNDKTGLEALEELVKEFLKKLKKN